MRLNQNRSVFAIVFMLSRSFPKHSDHLQMNIWIIILARVVKKCCQHPDLSPVILCNNVSFILFLSIMIRFSYNNLRHVCFYDYEIKYVNLWLMYATN